MYYSIVPISSYYCSCSSSFVSDLSRATSKLWGIFLLHVYIVCVLIFRVIILVCLLIFL